MNKSRSSFLRIASAETEDSISAHVLRMQATLIEVAEAIVNAGIDPHKHLDHVARPLVDAGILRDDGGVYRHADEP